MADRDGHGLQTTDMDEWRKIGKEVKRVDREVTELVNTLNSVPVTVWEDEHDRAYEGMTELKHVLEERMFKEHSDEAETSIFYGPDE